MTNRYQLTYKDVVAVHRYLEAHLEELSGKQYSEICSSVVASTNVFVKPGQMASLIKSLGLEIPGSRPATVRVNNQELRGRLDALENKVVSDIETRIASMESLLAQIRDKGQAPKLPLPGEYV